MSIPEMWLPIMNEIETDSELRGKFQFWAFGYPTGDPEALLAEEKPEMLFGRKAPFSPIFLASDFAARRTWAGKMMRLPSRPSGPLASVLPKCGMQIKTMRSIRGFASKMSDCLIREADGNSANRVAALSLKTFPPDGVAGALHLHLAYQAVSFDHRQPRT